MTCGIILSKYLIVSSLIQNTKFTVAFRINLSKFLIVSSLILDKMFTVDIGIILSKHLIVISLIQYNKFTSDIWHHFEYILARISASYKKQLKC